MRKELSFQISRVSQNHLDRTMRIKEFQRIHLDEVKLLNEIESKRQKFLSQRRDEKLEQTLDRIGLPVKCTNYKSQNCEPQIQFNF